MTLSTKKILNIVALVLLAIALLCQFFVNSPKTKSMCVGSSTYLAIVLIAVSSFYD
jgi:hypothetical protein